MDSSKLKDLVKHIPKGSSALYRNIFVGGLGALGVGLVLFGKSMIFQGMFDIVVTQTGRFYTHNSAGWTSRSYF